MIETFTIGFTKKSAEEFFTKLRQAGELPQELVEAARLLCSEHLPEHCHRRLVVDYLDKHWGGVSVTHIT
jgi:hypothetical protein